MRGDDLSSAILELLCITLWGDLDLLILDMPPGIGDATLDVLALAPRCEFLVVCTPSAVVQRTVARTTQFLKDQQANIVGVVENLSTGDTAETQALAQDAGVPFLGAVPLDVALEQASGCAEPLAATAAAAAVAKLDY